MSVLYFMGKPKKVFHPEFKIEYFALGRDPRVFRYRGPAPRFWEHQTEKSLRHHFNLGLEGMHLLEGHWYASIEPGDVLTENRLARYTPACDNKDFTKSNTWLWRGQEILLYGDETEEAIFGNEDFEPIEVAK